MEAGQGLTGRDGARACAHWLWICEFICWMMVRQYSDNGYKVVYAKFGWLLLLAHFRLVKQCHIRVLVSLPTSVAFHLNVLITLFLSIEHGRRWLVL